MTRFQRYCWFIVLAIISACSLAYELALIDLINIVQWSHFSFMIISLALLGFGASGTYLAILQQKIDVNYAQSFFRNSLLFSLMSLICFLIAERIPFSALSFVWDVKQSVYLSLIYLTLGLPFFFASNCVGLSFFQFHSKVNIAYAFDLFGAAIGCILAVILFYLVQPISILSLISVISLLGSILFASLFFKQLYRAWLYLILVAVLLIGIVYSPYFLLTPTQSKPLMVQLNTLGTKKLTEQHNPMGLISVVENTKVPLHYAPGISLYNSTPIPRQVGVYRNYDALQAVTKYSGDLQTIKYLDYMTSAVAYHIQKIHSALLLNVGTGATTLLARYHLVSNITQTETNPIIFRLMEKKLAEYSGHVFADTQTKVTQARAYIMSTKNKYDLINIPLSDSSTSQGTSTLSGEQGYLFTTEAFSKMLSHLTSNGLIQVTQWLKLPPRNSIKLTALALTVLKQQQVSSPAQHLVLIRGWKTFTLLIKKSPFTRQEIVTLRSFCKERGFDLVYYPGIKIQQANVFNKLQKPYYYRSIQALLQNLPQTLKAYKFDIRPNTDNHPFFFDFFKLNSLKEIWNLRLYSHGLLDWGYLLNGMTLVQAFIFSIIFIILPIIFLRRKQLKKKTIVSIGFTFLCIGFAYMLTEINYIQRLGLYFSNTVTTIAMVIATFLVFSALGSAVSKRLLASAKERHSRIVFIIGAIVVLNIAYIYLLPKCMSLATYDAGTGKLIISIVMLAPLAFLMGIPFPYYLAEMTKDKNSTIAIAWACNGCASVIASVASSFLALGIGLNAVIYIATILYALSYLSYYFSLA